MKHGDCGSVWLSVDDKPAKDLSEVLDQADRLLEKEILSPKIN